MHLLDGPLVFDEARRQIIEQLRMRGPAARLSVLARRIDDAGSEMMHPDAVDHDSCGQGILGIGDGFRELQPSAALRKGLRLALAQDGDEACSGEPAEEYPRSWAFAALLMVTLRALVCLIRPHDRGSLPFRLHVA